MKAEILALFSVLEGKTLTLLSLIILEIGVSFIRLKMFPFILRLQVLVRVFLIFCAIKLEIHMKCFCYIQQYDDCLKKKHFCDWVMNWIGCFFHRIPFYLKEPKTNWLLRLRYLADVLSKKKKNGVNLSLQGR